MGLFRYGVMTITEHKLLYAIFHEPQRRSIGSGHPRVTNNLLTGSLTYESSTCPVEVTEIVGETCQRKGPEGGDGVWWGRRGEVPPSWKIKLSNCERLYGDERHLLRGLTKHFLVSDLYFSPGPIQDRQGRCPDVSSP